MNSGNQTNNKCELIQDDKPYLHLDDKRNKWQWISNIGDAVMSQFSDLATRPYYTWYHKQLMAELYLNLNEVTNGYPIDKLQDKEYKRLVVFIHGHRGPRQPWLFYYQKLKELWPIATTCYIAPEVPHGGACTLEDAAKPILDYIHEFLKLHPASDLVLIGTSNGSRIASHIEHQLDIELIKQVNNIDIISIAGVLYGTKLVDWLEQKKLLKYAYMHPSIAEDFHWSSNTSVQEYNALMDRQKVWSDTSTIKVRHLFIASTEDEKVTLSSSLISLPNAHYKIYHGYTHQTIVYGAMDDIISWLHGYSI